MAKKSSVAVVTDSQYPSTINRGLTGPVYGTDKMGVPGEPGWTAGFGRGKAGYYWHREGGRQNGRLLVNPKGPRPATDKTTGKYTEVSFISYAITRGLITLDEVNRQKIGYLKLNPLEVLAIAFPEYHIGEVQGHEFMSYDPDPNVLVGLGLKPVNPTRFKKQAGDSLDDLLKPKQLKEVRRIPKVTPEEARIIIEGLEEDAKGTSFAAGILGRDKASQDAIQVLHDLGKIIEVLQQYAGKH